METQTLTIAEFLLARIAEHESYAPKYHSSMCEWMMRQDVDDLAECDCGFDARRTFHLAECEAKRRIIEWHQNWPVFVEGPPELGQPIGTDIHQMTLRMSRQIAWMTEQQYRAQFGDEPPTSPILLMLAQPYADHPDFRDEWRA